MSFSFLIAESVTIFNSYEDAHDHAHAYARRESDDGDARRSRSCRHEHARLHESLYALYRNDQAALKLALRAAFQLLGARYRTMPRQMAVY